jgi:hypothetical protein
LLRTLEARLGRLRSWIPKRILSGCRRILALCPSALPGWLPGSPSGWALESAPCLFHLRLESGCWPSRPLGLRGCRGHLPPRCKGACRRSERNGPGPPSLWPLRLRLTAP